MSKIELGMLAYNSLEELADVVEDIVYIIEHDLEELPMNKDGLSFKHEDGILLVKFTYIYNQDGLE